MSSGTAPERVRGSVISALGSVRVDRGPFLRQQGFLIESALGPVSSLKVPSEVSSVKVPSESHATKLGLVA